jgi:phosphatidylethanolamine-binding protein (PEBP) family uncharacterized protein
MMPSFQKTLDHGCQERDPPDGDSLALTVSASVGYAASPPKIAKLHLTSGSLSNGFPIDLTCDGSNADTSNISPPDLTWGKAPKGTKSWALIMSDPDAPNGTFFHLGLFNIKPSRTGIPANADVTNLGTTAVDDADLDYYPPCPPPGSPHGMCFSYLR